MEEIEVNENIEENLQNTAEVSSSSSSISPTASYYDYYQNEVVTKLQTIIDNENTIIQKQDNSITLLTNTCFLVSLFFIYLILHNMLRRS